MDDAISIDGLTKYYGSRRVVHGLSLNVPVGTVYGLLGRNGAGKSTTIKMLLGLVRPDQGSATLLGDDCRQLSPATRGRVTYLGENHPLYGWMNATRAADFCAAMHPRWNKRLFEQIVDHFAIPARTRVGRLSNGQRAQLSLALGVASEPDVLILDDPTLGLDTVVRRDFLESLVQIIQRPGRTILFSSHILSDVERIADRIGVMVDGVLRADCPTDVFKQSIRRVTLEFDRQPPAEIRCPRLVNSWSLGSRLEVVVLGYDAEQQQALADLNPTGITVEELNLEDAFVAYTRKSRRALPVFAGSGEVNHGSGTG